MDFSFDHHAQAVRLKCRAEYLACHQLARRNAGPLTVPADWTTWLLMDKAGVPRELIAYYGYVDRRHLNRRLRAARALLIFVPFADRIDELMKRMPRFSPAMEGACVAPAE